MAERIDVFISSTSRDLTDFRDAVAKVILRLDMFPIDMANFNATDRNALQLCYDKVQEAEIFIGIYAHRYGYAPDESVTYTTTDGKIRMGDGTTSITHWEYQWAIERNLPMLLFVVDEDVAWQLDDIEDETDKSRLKNFKALIGNHYVWETFSTPDNLAAKVATSLSEIIRKRILSIDRNNYLAKLKAWADNELYRLETSPLKINHQQRSHIPIRLRVDGQILTSEEFYNLNGFFDKTNILLLVGNGGSGKSTTLLTWLSDMIQNQRLPVYVALANLTPQSSILDLIQASFGRHGINITDDILEKMLSQEYLTVILDGINEIHQVAWENGALSDILTFADKYPRTRFIFSSRYITAITNLNRQSFTLAETIPWDQKSIYHYLILRLGKESGKKAFDAIGDEIDFDWLQGSSIAGFCSNPLILWMIATVAEDKNVTPEFLDNVIDEVISIMIRKLPTQYSNLPRTLIQDLLKEFAYLMLDAGYNQSIPYDDAVRISQEIRNYPRAVPLPQQFDAYSCLSLLTETGILKRNGEMIEWLHQIIQEHLSIQYAVEKFKHFDETCASLLCPDCRYRADRYYVDGARLWGICTSDDCNSSDDEEKHFQIPVINIPDEHHLQENVRFIDKTGVPIHPDSTSIPNSFIDEGFLWKLPMMGMVYTLGLSFAQQNRITTKTELLRHGGPDRNELLFDIEVHALILAGLMSIEQEEDNLSVISILLPRVNPSARSHEYILVTLRDMTYEEMDEEPDEWLRITSAKAKERHQKRKDRNLPIYHYYPFGDEHKNKVFSIAQKYGGQVMHAWGTFQEVVAEFSGEAWDFTGYASENDTV